MSRLPNRAGAAAHESHTERRLANPRVRRVLDMILWLPVLRGSQGWQPYRAELEEGAEIVPRPEHVE